LLYSFQSHSYQNTNKIFLVYLSYIDVVLYVKIKIKVVNMLEELAREGNLEGLKKKIENEAGKKRARYARVALKAAAKHNQKEVVGLLLTKKAWFGGLFVHSIESAALAAIEARHIDMAKLLLKVDIKRALHKPQELLKLAAKHGNVDLVVFLLARRDLFGNRIGFAIKEARLAAVEAGHIGVLEYLFCAAKETDPYKMYELLKTAASCGQEEVVVFLLTKEELFGDRFVDAIGSATLAAIEARHIGIAQLLLQRVAGNISLYHARKSLVEAIKCGQVDLVGLVDLMKRFLTHQNKIDIMSQLLETAAKHGREEVVDLLLTKEEWFGGRFVNAIGRAILAAIKARHIGITHSLLQRVAGDISWSHARESLVEATKCGQVDLVERFLTHHNKSDIITEREVFMSAVLSEKDGMLNKLFDYTNKFGNLTDAMSAALKTAAANGRKEAVKLLLTKKDWFGDEFGSALGGAALAAIEAGYVDIALLLLQSDGCDKIPSYNMPQLLKTAARCGHAGVVNLIVNKEGWFGDEFGSAAGNAVLAAIKAGYVDIALLLLQSDGCDKIPSYNMPQLLETAARCGHAGVVNLIVNKEGWFGDEFGSAAGNAVLAAIEAKHTDIAQFLLQTLSPTEVLTALDKLSTTLLRDFINTLIDYREEEFSKQSAAIEESLAGNDVNYMVEIIGEYAVGPTFDSTLNELLAINRVSAEVVGQEDAAAAAPHMQDAPVVERQV
jgi:ankyrin repeat protein